MEKQVLGFHAAIKHKLPDAIRHVVRVCGGCGVLDSNGPELDCLLCQWGGFVPYWGLRGTLIQYLICKNNKVPKIEKGVRLNAQ